jgi:uncharacterized protein (DUF1697 family)
MSAVVFLRGMNLGRRRVTNDELIAVFTDAGYTDVWAYQASGNVVLGAVESVDAASISATLMAALGYSVEVFVRSAAELHSIAATSPIKGRAGAAGGKPQIVFLATAAPGGGAPPQELDLGSVFPADHEVHHVGSELHWLPPGGLSEIGNLQYVMDKVLGYTTVRTLGTIERLASRLS